MQSGEGGRETPPGREFQAERTANTKTLKLESI